MTLISAFLDIIYPPFCFDCGKKLSNHGLFYICPDCFVKILFIKKPVCPFCGAPGYESSCLSCPAGKFSFSFMRAAVPYRGLPGRAVKSFKYGRGRWLAKTLVKLLEKGIAEFPELAHAEIIVPVPLARARQKERGFNQSLILAGGAGRFLGRKVSEGNLVRIRNSRPQAGLPAAERKQNVIKAFRVRKESEFEGRKVMLVDDVLTTGTTADECAAELLGSGAASVFVLVLARRFQNPMISP